MNSLKQGVHEAHRYVQPQGADCVYPRIAMNMLQYLWNTVWHRNVKRLDTPDRSLQKDELLLKGSVL